MMKKYNTDSTMDEKDVKDHKWNLFKLFADMSGTKLVTTTRCRGTRTGCILIVNRGKVNWSFVSLKAHKSKCHSSKNTRGVVTVLAHEDLCSELTGDSWKSG